MSKRTILAAVLTLLWAGTGAALPWVKDRVPAFAPSNPECRPVDFSGYWAGKCNGAPSEDLTIEQDSESITLRYSGMKERIALAHMQSKTDSDGRVAESHNSTAHWSCDAQKLVILGGDLFSRPNAAAHAFWSKVLMSVENGLLIVDADSYATNTNDASTERDRLYCQYWKRQG